MSLLSTPIDRRRALTTAITTTVGLALAYPALAAGPAPGSLAREPLFDLLRQPGHVGFMRHAWAPFEGAPKSKPHAAEAIGPCETQRNLDAHGRADAKRLGELFRAANLSFDFVYTSHVCRCRETAELMMQRPVENLPLINSYFSDPDKARGPAQIKYLKQFLNQTLAPHLRGLMVTHGSLISDLSRIDTYESEIVVVKADGAGDVRIVGRGRP
jgi:phosphohistidine phosphatase SixA